MNRDLALSGGLAALACAGSFVFGFALFLTTLSPYLEYRNDADFAVQFVLSHHDTLALWNLVIYVGFGVALAVLALAEHERLRDASPRLARLGVTAGLVWVGLVVAAGMVATVGLERVVEIAPAEPARAASLWLAVNTVTEGLGGGNEIVGGLWVLVISAAAWRERSDPRWLSATGLIAGFTGVASTVPGLGDLGAVFGLVLIAWFAALGVRRIVERLAARPAGTTQAYEESPTPGGWREHAG